MITLPHGSRKVSTRVFLLPVKSINIEAIAQSLKDKNIQKIVQFILTYSVIVRHYFCCPPTKLRKVNVFSHVCLSVCRGGGPKWPLPMMRLVSHGSQRTPPSYSNNHPVIVVQGSHPRPTGCIQNVQLGPNHTGSPDMFKLVQLQNHHIWTLQPPQDIFKLVHYVAPDCRQAGCWHLTGMLSYFHKILVILKN